MNSREFKLAVENLSKEKGIDKDVIFDAMELALTSAYKKNYHSLSNVREILIGKLGKLPLEKWHVFCYK